MRFYEKVIIMQPVLFVKMFIGLADSIQKSRLDASSHKL